MALIKCPECGKEISDAAVKCPNCGYPVKAEQKKKEKENKNQKLVECPECHNMVESQYKTYLLFSMNKQTCQERPLKTGILDPYS